MTDINPIADYAVIRPIRDEQQTTAGGIHIPDSAQKKKPERGEVLAIGPGRMEDGQRIKPEVSEGDVVLFKKHGGYQTAEKVDGENLLIMEASTQIMGVVG